ncbi:PaaI family thioesterase [Brachybacterium sp. AOP25-B2-12]|uniref:PaaI family thioesterase n=1 Tax=Brachybacterium sp. AOP25-B2-12 TaxID=3457710 RepID=UPI00403317C2
MPETGSVPSPAPLPWTPEEVGSILRGTLCERLGMQLLALDAEGGTMTMPVQGNTQPAGLLHGGATIALAESVASFAAILLARRTHGPEAQAVGTHVTAVHHRSARTGIVTATCTAVHTGRTLATYAVQVRDEADRLLSTVSVSTMLLAPR